LASEAAFDVALRFALATAAGDEAGARALVAEGAWQPGEDGPARLFQRARANGFACAPAPETLSGDGPQAAVELELQAADGRARGRVWLLLERAADWQIVGVSQQAAHARLFADGLAPRRLRFEDLEPDRDLADSALAAGILAAQAAAGDEIATLMMTELLARGPQPPIVLGWILQAASEGRHLRVLEARRLAAVSRGAVRAELFSRDGESEEIWLYASTGPDFGWHAHTLFWDVPSLLQGL
jgi:hypothetical protein